MKISSQTIGELIPHSHEMRAAPAPVQYGWVTPRVGLPRICKSGRSNTDGKTKTPPKSTDTMDTPLELFVHELSDIRSAETIILTMLEEAIEAVSNTQLKAGLKAHHKQTEQHLANVDQVFALIERAAGADRVQGRQGSARRGAGRHQGKAGAGDPRQHDRLGRDEDRALRDRLLRRAGRSGEVAGQSEAAKLLQANLKDEKETLKKLEELEPKLSTKVEKLGS